MNILSDRTSSASRAPPSTTACALRSAATLTTAATAACKRWDGAKWQHVLSRSIAELGSREISYISRELTPADHGLFGADAEALLAAAVAIVGGVEVAGGAQ